MKKLILYLIFLVTVLPVSLQAAGHKEMSLIISSGYPPYYFRIGNAEPEGLCVEVVNEAAKLQNIKIKYIVLAWSKCLSWMKFGKADAIMPLLKTPEREAFLYYVEGNDVAIDSNAFFFTADSDIKYTGDFKELKDYLIGYIKDYSYGPEFDNADFLNKDPARTEISMINELVSKRRDIIIGSVLVIKHQAGKMGLSGRLVDLKPHLNDNPMFIGFSKKRGKKQQAEEFAKALKQFKTTDKYKEILLKYGVE